MTYVASPSTRFAPVATLEGRVREQFTAILCRSFPPNEHESVESIDQRLAGGARLYGAFSGEDLVGFALMLALDVEGVYLLDYLAVADTHRNQGLGHAFLDHLRAEYGSIEGAAGILLEVESDQWGTEEERYLRARRVAFYRRNGAVSLPLSRHLEMPAMDDSGCIYTKLMWLPLSATTPTGGTLRRCLVSFLWHCYGLAEETALAKAALAALPE